MPGPGVDEGTPGLLQSGGWRRDWAPGALTALLHAQRATGYAVGGVGWYRRQLRVPVDPGQRAFVLFEGVYMGATVWLNGQLLGHRPYGYSTFHFDLTPHLYSDGRPNVLAVRVANLGRNSRWYSGSGIYRNVWLALTPAVHVDLDGLYVRC